MSHVGSLQGFFKSSTSLLKVVYKSATSLIHTSVIGHDSRSRVRGHGTLGWVMGDGSWGGRGHGSFLGS